MKDKQKPGLFYQNLIKTFYEIRNSGKEINTIINDLCDVISHFKMVVHDPNFNSVITEKEIKHIEVIFDSEIEGLKNKILFPVKVKRLVDIDKNGKIVQATDPDGRPRFPKNYFSVRQYALVQFYLETAKEIKAIAKYNIKKDGIHAAIKRFEMESYKTFEKNFNSISELKNRIRKNEKINILKAIEYLEKCNYIKALKEAQKDLFTIEQN